MEPNKMRCHISIVIENAGRLLGVLFAIALSQIDDIVRNLSKINHLEGKTYFIGLGIFLILVIIVLLLNLNRWYRTLIWLEDGTLIVEQNTLHKKKNTYTLKNISNIDMEQNLFERIIGTYKIKIDTNSSALAKKTDIKIVFSGQKAQEFKKAIMSSMEQVEDIDLLESKEEYDVVYSSKQILLNCFYTANIFSLLFLIAGIVAMLVFLQIGDEKYTVADFMRDAIGSFAAILIAFISAAYSLINGFFKYYDFKIKRNGERIQLTYGLFRKNIHTLPVDKINGIKLVQPFFSRIFGRYQVEIINVGTGDEKNESANLLLSCTKKEVKQYMSVLLPEFEDFIDKPIKKASKKYFWHIGYCILWIIIVFWIGFATFNYFSDIVPVWAEVLSIAGVSILVVICSTVAYLAGGYYVGDDYLIAAKGIFTKTCFMIRYEKIQHIQMNESFMSKLTKLKNSTIHILAALTSSSMSLPLLEEDTLEKIARKMIEAS